MVALSRLSKNKAEGLSNASIFWIWWLKEMNILLSHGSREYIAQENWHGLGLTAGTCRDASHPLNTSDHYE